MRKQIILLLIALFVLYATSSQISGLRVRAAPDDAAAATISAQHKAPSGQQGTAFLTGPTAGDPLAIALKYLHEQAGSLGLSADDLADVVVTDRYVTQHNGVTHLYLGQRYHGIELFNGIININISRSGEVINLGNRFVGNLAQAVNTDTPTLTAAAAVESAARQLKLKLTAPIQVLEERSSPARELRVRAAGLAQNVIPLKLVYQRQADKTVRLAWSLFIEPEANRHYWHLRIDAVTGALLAQDDLILSDSVAIPWMVANKQEQPLAATAGSGSKHDDDQPPSPLTPPTYRVFPVPLEHPNDGAGLPDTQALVNNPADTLASPYGWLDVDGTPGHEFRNTRGNNVSAQEDRNDDNNNGVQPTGVDPDEFNFDYAFDPTLDPTAGDNTAAAIVNLFYWNNVLHDVAYHYGFDEASGNFQENNYMRGGLEADAVQADAQDGYDWGARNNAYFMITPDGVPPRLGMFVFDYTSPNRDSALDNGIIIHEYSHGISSRLVGGPTNPYCLYNAEQMGEGWSDWFTLALTTKADDTGADSRGLGTYVLGQPLDGPGIRRYPYSTNMSVNPFTYGDLPDSFGDIYLIGQIWGSMLWELQWNLIEQSGFDANLYTGTGGNNLALRLVTDGMKLAPCEPGFVDARDAILTADLINYNGANQCTIWQAFAKRGLGVSAQQGDPNNFSDGSESFDLPTVCRDDLSLTKLASPDPVAAGKVLTYELAVGNYTDQALTDVLLSDPIPAHTTYVADSASDGGSEAGGVISWQLPSLNPDESITRTFQVTVDRDYPDPVEFFFDDMEMGDINWTATGLWHLQTDGEACGNSFSPTHSWYYGASPGCSYTDDSSGELTSAAPISLPFGRLTLQFMSWAEYETCCDALELLVSTDGVNFSQIWNASNSSAQWNEVSADLSAYAGESIWLRFAFRSDSSVTYRGWYVDDVRLIAAQSIVNTATLTTSEGLSATATTPTAVIKAPEIVVSPTAFEETLSGGTKLTRTLTISNVGTAPLNFALSELEHNGEEAAQALLLSQPASAMRAQLSDASYAGDRLVAHPDLDVTPKPGGLTGATSPNVLLLATTEAYQIQSLLAAYPDLGQVDIYDARTDTPTLEELKSYATVIVLANYAFASPVDVGDRLADYLDEGGTVIQSVATFYDPLSQGWGLRGRFIDDGYSPFVGIGDLFSFAELGNFDASHPIMQGVTTAGDSLRQQVELTPGAQWVASWTDDEFVATKGNVVALNTFLADGYNWVGDIPLIVHNSIIWLQDAGGGDAPWLTTSVVSGTLAAGESQRVELTLDASTAVLEQAGDYAATLKIVSNDPDSLVVNIPITMHVLGPELSVVNSVSYSGREATLPLMFTSHDLAIAAVAFSLDFDESCLHFDPTDANGNGIPDAIKALTPPGVELVVSANISDTNGEVDIFIGDLTPPISALPDGVLATVNLKALCQPNEEPMPVRVGFSAEPVASFSDLNGLTILGRLVEGAVEIQPGLSGDCNQDNVVNAADAVSCVLEIFDGDGSFWLDAAGGTFPGSPHGCDSNVDEQIDAGDILCTVLTIFEGQGACGPRIEVASAQAAAASTLAIPEGIMAEPGGMVKVPVHFTGNGNAIGAAVFTVRFNPAHLQLDPTDSDGNGIPDAITFTLPEAMATSVMVVDNQQIQIAIADFSLPFVTLPDGPLATIAFTATGPAEGEELESIVTFAGELPASLGTHTGQSAAVTTDDGSVLFTQVKTAEDLMDKTYLPWVER